MVSRVDGDILRCTANGETDRGTLRGRTVQVDSRHRGVFVVGGVEGARRRIQGYTVGGTAWTEVDRRRGNAARRCGCVTLGPVDCGERGVGASTLIVQYIDCVG